MNAQSPIPASVAWPDPNMGLKKVATNFLIIGAQEKFKAKRVSGQRSSGKNRN